MRGGSVTRVHQLVWTGLVLLVGALRTIALPRVRLVLTDRERLAIPRDVTPSIRRRSQQSAIRRKISASDAVKLTTLPPRLLALEADPRLVVPKHLLHPDQRATQRVFKLISPGRLARLPR